MTKIIAFYLPQFHTIKENNEWWGEGFTEWTNVKNAKPLFKGHIQPRIPRELGYYSLLDSEVREKQAELARDNGIYGFCYWHYWFGNGKKLLERPFDSVLNSGKPNYPFCLGWANESWQSKVWGIEGRNKVLIEQKYLGVEDNQKHFYDLLSAFEDERYIKIDGKCLFYVYKPLNFAGMREFIKQWRLLAKTHFFDFYFVANARSFSEHDELLNLGFDAVNVNPISRIFQANNFVKLEGIFQRKFNEIFHNHSCHIVAYKKAMRRVINSKQDLMETVIPSIVPNWDHSPRSGKHASIISGFDLKAFSYSVERVLEISKKKNNKLVFLKSWNEWGEGNFIEPDQENGKELLETISRLSK
jgi:hypothetical protein